MKHNYIYFAASFLLVLVALILFFLNLNDVSIFADEFFIYISLILVPASIFFAIKSCRGAFLAKQTWLVISCIILLLLLTPIFLYECGVLLLVGLSFFSKTPLT